MIPPASGIGCNQLGCYLLVSVDSKDSIRCLSLFEPVMAKSIGLNAIIFGIVEVPRSWYARRAKLCKRVVRRFEHENIGVEAIGKLVTLAAIAPSGRLFPENIGRVEVVLARLASVIFAAV